MWPEDFDFWCDNEKLRVRFVSARALGTLKSGHRVGGDYADRVIRLPRYETRNGHRICFWHEFGHYLYERQELTRGMHEETVVDILTWVEVVLNDDRNTELRAFLLKEVA